MSLSNYDIVFIKYYTLINRITRAKQTFSLPVLLMSASKLSNNTMFTISNYRSTY